MAYPARILPAGYEGGGMRVKAGLVAGLLLMVGLTGCGSSNDGDDSGVASVNGSGKPSSSSSAGADTKSDQQKVLEYAKCMRENGIPDFQDPEFKDGVPRMMLPEGVDMNTAKKASEACKQYMPSGGDKKAAEDPEVTGQLKKFAQCMRTNGVSNFPDPQAGGGGMVVGEGEEGLRPEDPKFKAAQQACASLQPDAAMKPGQGGGTAGSKG